MTESGVTVVAIDGPVGSGKSTVARAVAGRLGLAHLDTGAMYRSAAVAVMRQRLDPESASPEAMAEVVKRSVIDVGDRVLLDGNDITDLLRIREEGEAVSAVAACAEVRAELVTRQRAWAAEHRGGVVEGRDIASVVFPDATLKVFLTASDEERARRRSSDEDPAALARRDQMDSTRTASPLAVADDAVVIDTTDRSVDDVVDDIVARVAAAAPPPPPPPPPQPPAPAQTAAPPKRTSVPPRTPAPPAPAPVTKPSRSALLLYGRVRWLVGTICRGYWDASYEGLEHVPAAGPFVLAPVHRSFIDFGLVAAVSKRRIRYMGKDSLWKVSWFGRFITALGAFPVRRGAADREALRRCIEIIDSGEPLVLFPEGTRRTGPTVHDLFEGAAYVAIRTGVPIVPAGIG